MSQPVHIDINCDMGESYGRWTLGNDAELMPFLSSANIACGFHGGDPHVMRNTVRLARKHGVAVGAHVSFPDLIVPDLRGFGESELGPDGFHDVPAELDPGLVGGPARPVPGTV